MQYFSSVVCHPVLTDKLFKCPGHESLGGNCLSLCRTPVGVGWGMDPFSDLILLIFLPKFKPDSYPNLKMSKCSNLTIDYTQFSTKAFGYCAEYAPQDTFNGMGGMFFTRGFLPN